VIAQESRKNQLKDFVDIAGPLGVSHFMILTATENAAYLRLAKTPRVGLLTASHKVSLCSLIKALMTFFDMMKNRGCHIAIQL
jgi:hypothetical protein